MATVLNDTFTEAGSGSYVYIYSHTAETGGQWVVHPYSNGNFAYARVWQTEDAMTALGAYDSMCMAYSPATPANADVKITGSILMPVSGGGTYAARIFIGARCTTTSPQNGYFLLYEDYPPAQGWSLCKWTANGTYSVIGARVGTNLITRGSSTPVSASLYCVGTTIASEVNGTTLHYVTDTSYSAAGKFAVGGNEAWGYSDNTNTLNITSVIGTDSATLPAPPPSGSPYRQRASGLMVPGRFVR